MKRDADWLVNELGLKGHDASAVHQALQHLPERIRQEWLEKVQVKSGRISGTYYEQIADHLSFNQFCALYQAIGYQMELMSAWRDHRCVDMGDHYGCIPSGGNTCDPDFCH